MSVVTELSGERCWLQLAGTLYKVQGQIAGAFTIRKANARGSGDSTPRPKPIGLDDGAALSCNVISSDRNILTLHGTELTDSDVVDDTTDVYGAFTCLLEVEESDDVEGMVTFAVTATPLSMPGTIDHLDY